ncbi:hypothetical protein Hypma_003406 [Hypsizygus marmoreus]|uniref:Uncharacterized protein n=1 Tax=Hypsizygus marmoreus TaxID=39966 RepID=A0A369J292_HYPMA|nr:hypothetical protein Hypma_003406 [Hypsizygus marmoreus]
METGKGEGRARQANVHVGSIFLETMFVLSFSAHAILPTALRSFSISFNASPHLATPAHNPHDDLTNGSCIKNNANATYQDRDDAILVNEWKVFSY